MKRRGPKLLVEKLFEEIKTDDNETYIIIYSTKEYHPPSDFYKNLRRLRELAGEKLESSLRGMLICKSSKIAIIAHKLVRKYCHNVSVFKVIGGEISCPDH